MFSKSSLDALLADLGVTRATTWELIGRWCDFSGFAQGHTDTMRARIRKVSVADELLTLIIDPTPFHGEKITQIMWQPRDQWFVRFLDERLWGIFSLLPP